VNSPTLSDIKELEITLRAMRQDVLDAIRVHLSSSGDDEPHRLANHIADGDSPAEAAFLSDNDLALLHHEQSDLAAIDAALKRIEFGVGGICIECGEPIPAPRLRAAPTALTCLECQARLEQQAATQHAAA